MLPLKPGSSDITDKSINLLKSTKDFKHTEFNCLQNSTNYFWSVQQLAQIGRRFRYNTAK